MDPSDKNVCVVDEDKNDYESRYALLHNKPKKDVSSVIVPEGNRIVHVILF